MRIGIIGCGYVFDHYMNTMDRHPELEIIGVADLDATRLARVCEFYDLKPYPDVASLLAEDSIDTIVNLTSIAARL